MIRNNEKIAIWGCGRRGREFIEKYKNTYNIVYCLDNKVDDGDQNESKFCEYKLYNPKHIEEDKNIVIIITMDQWHDVAKQLIKSGYKMFKDFYPFTYIDMDDDVAILENLDFLDYLDSDLEKEQKIREYANGRKICTTYGLCHMNIYKRILSETDEFKKKYMLLDLPAINAIDGRNYSALKENTVWHVSDVLICGIMDKSVNIQGDFPSVSELYKLVRKDCRIIRISGGAFKGFFPQHLKKSIRAEIDKNGIPLGRYVAWGDKNIDRLYSQGKSVQDIKNIVLDENFYESDFCIKFFDNEIKILESVEKYCDVKIADYIIELAKNKITHFSFTHPIPDVMLELSRRLLLAFGIDVKLDKFKGMKFLNMDSNEEIVYPSVLKAFKLNNKDNLERKVMPGSMLFDGRKISNEEYVEKYVKYLCEKITC